ncbi:MAG TPA: protein translocase subunit SecD [Spirochaetota bacterium]|nr:protein translocase subunit SecD [Spirochaetota bacterium]
MKSKILVRLFVILAICSLCAVFLLPTFGERTLKVSMKKGVSSEQIDNLKHRFSGKEIVSSSDSEIVFRGYGITDAKMNEVRSLPFIEDAVFSKHWAEKYFLAKKINLGLDLQGGMSLVLEADYARMEEKAKRKFTDDDKKAAVEQALEKISGRINQFGVSETSVRMKGVDSIEIQLPGVKDPKMVKATIGTTGRVEYRIVNDEFSAQAAAKLKEKNIEIPKLDTDQKLLLADLSKEINIPADMELLFLFDRDRVTNEIIPVTPLALVKEVSLEGGDIAKASVGTDSMGQYTVDFSLQADGAKKFAEVTSKKNIGKRLAIIIDNMIKSAPTIQTQISDGRANITGRFTFDEANLLTKVINEGALPVDLKIAEERTVGPSLGQDSIDAGMRALMVGACAVILFMLIYYKGAGVIANFCLIVNMMILLALLSMMGFTITLPGIAGLILTIGMAVDANVIIYERIKEELRHGKTPRAAVDAGFDRAFWTIFDSNITTLLAALILSRIGSGPIKGFAVTLSVGIISSMIAALFVSKMIFHIIVNSKKNMKSLSI